MMAKKKNPLKPIFDQLGEMINIFYSAEKESLSAAVPEGAEGRVMALRAIVDALEKSYYAALKEEGLSEKEIMDELLKNPGHMSKEDVQLVMKGVQMRTESLAIAGALDSKLKQEPKMQKRTKMQKIKDRSLRKSDRRRKKGWKRL